MRHRRGFRRVRVAFTGDHLTRFGGVLLLHLFFQRLQLRQRFTDRAYDYLYSPDELREWARTARSIAPRARVLYLMFNNHARGQVGQDGREMQHLITERPQGD